MNFLIRPALEKDSKWLSEQDKNFAQELIDNGVTGIQPSCFTEDIIKEHGFGANSYFSVLIAENSDGAVGYVLYVGSYDTGRASFGFEMIDIYVQPNYRRDGVAALLITGLKEECQKQNGKFIKWKFEEDNEQAIKFYKKINSELPKEERMGYLRF